jgi:hypothetical protein
LKSRQAAETADSEATQTPDKVPDTDAIRGTIGETDTLDISVSSPTYSMIMAEDLLAYDLTSQHMDLSALSDSDCVIPHSVYSVPECTCNPTTGPCSRHVDMLRGRPVSETSTLSPFQPPQSLSSNQPRPPSSLGRPQGYGNPALVAFALSPRASPGNGGSSSDVPIAASDASALDSRSRSSMVSFTAPMTPRFSVVFEAMYQAGFQDIEEMILAYYTSQFEWGSVPAMLQSVSRSRRLSTMLHVLQQNSSQWPRWQSRGLHEGVLRAAVSLCVGEISLGAQPSTASLPSNVTENFILLVEQLLQDLGIINSQDTFERLGEAGLFQHTDAAPDSVSRIQPAPIFEVHELTKIYKLDATSLVLANGIGGRQ